MLKTGNDAAAVADFDRLPDSRVDAQVRRERAEAVSRIAHPPQ